MARINKAEHESNRKVELVLATGGLVVDVIAISAIAPVAPRGFQRIVLLAAPPEFFPSDSPTHILSNTSKSMAEASRLVTALVPADSTDPEETIDVTEPVRTQLLNANQALLSASSDFERAPCVDRVWIALSPIQDISYQTRLSAQGTMQVGDVVETGKYIRDTGAKAGVCASIAKSNYVDRVAPEIPGFVDGLTIAALATMYVITMLSMKVIPDIARHLRHLRRS